MLRLSTVCFFFLIGCGAWNIFENEDEERAANVVVTNYNWADVVVFVYPAFSPSIRTRLGEVPSMGERNFTVPTEILTDQSGFSIFVRLIGSTTKSYSTGVINAYRAQKIEVTIHEYLPYSSYVVKYSD